MQSFLNTLEVEIILQLLILTSFQLTGQQLLMPHTSIHSCFSLIVYSLFKVFNKCIF